IRASAYLLRDGGGLFIVHREERREELLSLMRVSGLCPKLIRPVLHEAGAKSGIFLAFAVKGGSGEAEEKPLILYENGAYTPEAARIYGEVSYGI
ncbi:MAG: SAM-dependent methyltransferase, partial [Clostridia bacterium]|nr:SAM-dependent methyltransferase [Clostridia bacterium]